MAEMPLPRRHRYASLMPPARQAAIEQHKSREASYTSQMSTLSIASSSVSDFLAEKINYLSAEKDMLTAYREGLFDLRQTGDLEEEEFQKELQNVVDTITPLNKNIRVMEGQKRSIEQDMEEELEGGKRQRGHEPDLDFFERAYTNSIVPRVMGASAKQAKVPFTKHDQADFRRGVLERYNALTGPSSAKQAWCHLTGWWDPKLVKAAHLVPKQLTGPEIYFLFGASEEPLHDPRNGISLHANIETALDQGKIVIVPDVPEHAQTVQWRCVLVDETMRDLVVVSNIRSPMSPEPPTVVITKWKDLDGRLLTFRSDNRPARRFLYFRFIITYIHAKICGNSSFTSTVEARKKFWASPGPYLERSTLKALARNISGLELPDSIFTNTFDGKDTSTMVADDVGTSLASMMRQATVESTKNLEADNDTDDEDDEEDL